MLEGVGSRRVRLLALVAASLLAFGVAACGSDDGDSGGSSNAAAEDTGGASGASSDPKKQLEADYDQFVDNIYDGRWQQACDGYSKAYVKVYPKQLKIAGTCEKTMSGEYKQIGALPRPWVDKVVIKSGTSAVAYTKTRDDSLGNPIKFVKEDGAWKLDGPVPQKQTQ